MSIAVRGKKIPPPVAGDSWDGALAQQQDENDEWERDPDEPGRMGMVFSNNWVAIDMWHRGLLD
jgi:hypothetical protein